ncbi:MAG: histidinol phosphate phosphatase [Elusimicrobia bacterium]|nr:histidinol phosphate phosphatase [Elusimicrobiota bacterium]
MRMSVRKYGRKSPSIVAPEASKASAARQINSSRVLSEGQRRTLLEAGLAFVQASNEIILRKIARGFKVETKSDGSYVTDADRDAERRLRGAIAERFPDHGILGEEFEPVRPKAEFQWIIDPIDGTLSFVKGIPTFGTILALRYREETVVGIIDLPAVGRRYSAAVGLGTSLNGKRIELKDAATESEIKDEIVAVCDRLQFERIGKEAAFERLLSMNPRARVYTDCFGHALAAQGAVGAMVDVGVRLWDIAATQVLVEEAGGRFEVLQGFEKAGTDTLYSIVCGKPGVVGWLLQQLR